MKETLKQRALALGFDDCRVTTAAAPQRAERLRQWLADGLHGEMTWLQRNSEKRADPQLVLPGARSIVTLAVSYGNHHNGEDPVAAEQPDARIARYARFSDYHDVLAGRLKELSGFIDEAGEPGSRSLWYVDTGPLLERELAERAGLGFVGKHTNLVSRRLGNWFFLSEIITTVAIEPDAAEHNRCGSCTRCIAACPTAAIPAPFQLDARRCISYLTIELKGSIPTELRPLIGNRIFGCDDCLAACPWNRFAREGSIMREHCRPNLAQPDLVELLSVTDSEFKANFAGTPLIRAKRRGLLRNVCVALGNVGGPSALPALHRARLDPEPLVREHAEWAITAIRDRHATAPGSGLTEAASTAGPQQASGR